MTARIDQILEVLEGVAPRRLAEGWDNPGLQVGGRAFPVSRILVALDPTPEAVREAARGEAQLLITHHPLIFKPLLSIEPTRYPGDALYEAVQNGVAVVSAHTNLDAAVGGVNDLLAGLLELEGISVLQDSTDPHPGEGLGRIGALREPLPLAGLAQKVKALFGQPVVGVIGPSERVVQRLAVVGGSGGGLIAAAAHKGADALVSGDIGHHDALAAITFGLAVIDAGHFSTEKAAMSGFRDALKSRLVEAGLGSVEVDVYHEETSPMWYA